MLQTCLLFLLLAAEPMPQAGPIYDVLEAERAAQPDTPEARAQWAEGLAQFQSQMSAIADSSMQEVVQAAAPAFALGFSFSAQKLINEEHDVLRVTLRHPAPWSMVETRATSERTTSC
mgnify:CR=1 FL=1